MTSQAEAETPKPHSKIDPLPYFPQLCRVLGGVTISIVLVYLEIHHSAPEPDPDAKPARAGLRNPPAMLDCDQACEDLGVSRRTLHTALESLGVWWKGESQRSGAARSGRDFLNSSLSFPASTHTPIRPYAIVGPRKHNQSRTLAIHRNQTRLDQIAIDADILKECNWAMDSTTCDSSRSLDSPGDVLESALNLRPRKGGIAWGWSQERVAQHSARMTELWAKRRETTL
jgi:hypothetical protein